MIEAAAAFPPPRDAAALYAGEVMHARMKPVAHRFAYRVYSLLVDVNRLDEADRLSPFFSVSRFNLTGFDPRDHGPRDGTSLKAYALDMLRRAGLSLDEGRVLLLCYPRIFGLVFNPLSVFFVYDGDDVLRGVLYEVRNTFGERHTYVAPVRDGEMSAAGLKQERAKLFYVSPFNGLEMRYLFRIRPPADGVALRIIETDSEGPLLSATFIGAKQPLTSPALLRAFFSVPLLTFKIVAGIHWEALRLWLKGMRLVPRPPAPEAASFIDLDPEARPRTFPQAEPRARR